MPVIFVLALLAMSVLLRRTVLGRSIYAVGGNALASHAAGIRVHRIKIICYALAGFLAGLPGICWLPGRSPSPPTRARAICCMRSPPPSSAG
jgi:ribose/xylose/arabinose/galactoside ABC-type transport system permease subunit